MNILHITSPDGEKETIIPVDKVTAIQRVGESSTIHIQMVGGARLPIDYNNPIACKADFDKFLEAIQNE